MVLRWSTELWNGHFCDTFFGKFLSPWLFFSYSKSLESFHFNDMFSRLSLYISKDLRMYQKFFELDYLLCNLITWVWSAHLMLYVNNVHNNHFFFYYSTIPHHYLIKFSGILKWQLLIHKFLLLTAWSSHCEDNILT